MAFPAIASLKSSEACHALPSCLEDGYSPRANASRDHLRADYTKGMVAVGAGYGCI